MKQIETSYSEDWKVQAFDSRVYNPAAFLLYQNRANDFSELPYRLVFGDEYMMVNPWDYALAYMAHFAEAHATYQRTLADAR